MGPSFISYTVFCPCVLAGGNFFVQNEERRMSPFKIKLERGKLLKQRKSKQMDESPFKEEMKKIAERMTELRGEKSVNAVIRNFDLMGLKISQSEYRRMENGEIMFRLDVIIALVVMSNTSYYYVFTGKSVTDDMNERMRKILKILELLSKKILELLKM